MSAQNKNRLFILRGATMRKFGKTLCLTAAALLTTALVYAQGPENSDRPDRPEKGKMDRFDNDRPVGMPERFDREKPDFDRDRFDSSRRCPCDGRRGDCDRFDSHRRGPMMPFADEDGQVEIAKVVGFLTKLDTDGDGFVSAEERCAFFAKKRENRPPFADERNGENRPPRPPMDGPRYGDKKDRPDFSGRERGFWREGNCPCQDCPRECPCADRQGPRDFPGDHKMNREHGDRRPDFDSDRGPAMKHDGKGPHGQRDSDRGPAMKHDGKGPHGQHDSDRGPAMKHDGKGPHGQRDTDRGPAMKHDGKGPHGQRDSDRGPAMKQGKKGPRPERNQNDRPAPPAPEEGPALMEGPAPEEGPAPAPEA